MRLMIISAALLFACRYCDAAYIDSVRGEVDLKKSGSSEWTRLAGDQKKTPLDAGDEMRTARASTVVLFMDDGSKVKLAPLSAFKMSAENKEAVSIGLFFGRVRSWVKKFSKKFEVRTPSAVCAVRGTDFMVSADAEGNSRVEVYEGSVLTGDSRGNSSLVREGQFSEIPSGGKMKDPGDNPNEPSDMNSSIGDARQAARAEIYGEISKEDVLARAQEEMQSAEYQNRKVAIDAFGNRVRMEEYTIRPAADQFKYVVLNTRADRFDFGKILFTFNTDLPEDLSQATLTMLSSPGTTAPEWQLTAMNSVMSNTADKVTEDAGGGAMVYNGSLTDPRFNLVFGNYSFYAAGPAEANDNGGLGKLLWTKTNYNVPLNTHGSISYLGGSAPVADGSFPSGEDVFHTFAKNTYGDGTWIAAQDFVLFNDGDLLSTGDFSGGLGAGDTVDEITDKLNFQRIYTSSLFSGRTINVMYSAKLLKEIGLLRF
ncbi:MAG: FecR domain-containing protein [Elusimicrobia bacterium]|nr:FecR domain-containing protein [Elusimicrobiota bacterium]